MNKILIVNEKHCTRYFDASTPELLNAAALKILKERWNEGYWYYLFDPPSEEGVLSEEQIAALPTEALKQRETETRQNYFREKYNWEKDQAEYKMIKKTVENSTLDNAWKCLYNRRDGQYEGVEIEELEQP